MSAKSKIEGLTNAWYGFDVTSAVVTFLMGSWGVFRLAGSILGLCLSLFITWAIGRALLNRSSLMRVVLLVASGLFTITGVIGTGRATLYLFDSFSLSLVGWIAWSCVSIYMMGRSFKTLVDGQVSAYFKS